MDRRQHQIALIMLAMVATLYLFLIAVIVDTLGVAAIPFVYNTCIPAAVLLLVIALFLIALLLTNITHALIMKWKEREFALQMKRADMQHYYRVKRTSRELELREQQRKLQPRRYRIIRCARHHQHLKRRRKDD